MYIYIYIHTCTYMNIWPDGWRLMALDPCFLPQEFDDLRRPEDVAKCPLWMTSCGKRMP